MCRLEVSYLGPVQRPGFAGIQKGRKAHGVVYEDLGLDIQVFIEICPAGEATKSRMY